MAKAATAGSETGPFFIRQSGTNWWLYVDIDSSGMSINWVNRSLATSFQTRKDAEAMIARVKERYSDTTEVVTNAI